jgi:hypothetical protein
MGILNLFGVQMIIRLGGEFFGRWRSLVWLLAVRRLNKRKENWCCWPRFFFQATAVGQRLTAVDDGGEQCAGVLLCRWLLA